jgi:hypothetical protein
MALWTEHLGIPSQVKEIDVNGRDHTHPGGLGREVNESTSFSAEFGWGRDLLMPKDVSRYCYTIFQLIIIRKLTLI